MSIQALPWRDFEALYHNHLVVDFPENERKTLSEYHDLYRRGLYDLYGLKKDKRLLAYGFIGHVPEVQSVLLDYLAVTKPVRGQGVGSVFLKALKAILKRPILLEVEDPKYTDKLSEQRTRKRRVAFYLKNGGYLSDISLNIYDDRFKIMVLSDEVCDDAQLRYDLKKLYRLLLTPSQQTSPDIFL